MPSAKEERSKLSTKLGDLFHAINILGIAGFGTSLVIWKEDGDVFDQAWLQEGFCLPHKNVPYRTTHDFSAYTMLIISLVGLVILYFLRDLPRTQVAKDPMARTLSFWALLGAIGHGIGHILISQMKMRGFYPESDMSGMDIARSESTWIFLFQVAAGYFLFWVPLVKTYMLHISQNQLALVAFSIQLVALYIPSKFGFSYTQMVLFAGLSFDQMLFVPVEQKGVAYALWPIMTVIPSTAFSWFESTSCTTSLLLRDFGHVVYDGFMASSYILYFLVCNWLQREDQLRSEKKLV